jgi:hypothetical protein
MPWNTTVSCLLTWFPIFLLSSSFELGGMTWDDDVVDAHSTWFCLLPWMPAHWWIFNLPLSLSN